MEALDKSELIYISGGSGYTEIKDGYMMAHFEIPPHENQQTLTISVDLNVNDIIHQ